jgi:hypothetical protein
VVGQGCFSSDVSIPNFIVTLPDPLTAIDPTKLLQITIRLDKSFFNLGNTKPADVKLYYYKDSTVLPPGYELKLCSVAAPPTAQEPCFAVPPRILKNSDTADKDLWGDLEFNIWALENGRYAN